MFETISNISGICIFFLSTALIAVAYHWVLRYWCHFSDRNVKFIRGAPLLGSAYKSILGIEPAAIAYRRCYDRFPAEKLCGIYKFGGRPGYLIRDPDTVKEIFVNDADHFDKSDLCARTFRMPAALGAEPHKMHPMMVKFCNEFIQHLKETDKTAKIFDSYDLFTRYSTDIMAKATFGVELNSLRDTENEVLGASLALSEFGYIDSLKFLLGSSIPSISNRLDSHAKDAKSADILRKMIENAVNEGHSSDSILNNMLSLMKKTKSNEPGKFLNDIRIFSSNL